MSGLALILTDAGRAALVNAQNTGTDPVVIAEIGVSATHTAGELTAVTALDGELKRLSTFAGDVVAVDTLHVTLRDESADAFSLRAFALYLDDGTLFGLYSQAGVILEKSTASILLLAVDVILTTLDTAEIEFGGTAFVNPPATTTVPGVVELATLAETATGTDGTRAVTPLGLASRLLAFALTGHTHAAGDIVSGVLNVLRIPDLAMSKITGLATALAGKSDTGHTHAAADVTSGVFSASRIPSLAMSAITGLIAALADKASAVHTHVMADVTGLVTALAGKSDTGHTHDASDIPSGVFSSARIPDLAMSKITGLVTALAGKSDTGHQHGAGDIISGVLNVLRIPDLAMSKITGLAAALADKISTGSAGLLSSLTIESNAPTLLLREVNETDNIRIYMNGGKVAIDHDPAGDGSYPNRPLFLDTAGQFAQIWGRTLVAQGDDASFGHVRATAGSDVGLSSSSHGFQIGPDNGSNLAMDTNEIMARDDGASADLLLQNDGGNVYINGSLAYHAGNIPSASSSTKGIVELATNSETQAGSDSTRAITAAGLASFAKSLGVSGYLRIPGTDLILQWGTLSGSLSETAYTINFPTTFPTRCVQLIGQVNNPSSDSSFDWIMQGRAKTASTGSLYLNKAGGSGSAPSSFDWFAIGY